MQDTRDALKVRFRSLRRSLIRTLFVQIISILAFRAFNYMADVLLIRPFDESTLGQIRIGLIALMICTSVFAGGRLMKLIVCRQELREQPVSLNNAIGFYAWFLVFFPLLGLLASRFGPISSSNPLIVLPVLWMPIYATLPLILICRRMNVK